MTDEEISIKSTKSEILEAYQEALQQIKESKKASKQEIKREQEKQEIIVNAAQNSTDSIVKNLANLKLELVKLLESLENQLLNEYKKFTTLQEAVAIQHAELQDLYDIKANADSLAALLQTQKQKKESCEKDIEEKRNSFEEEITGRRAEWKQEQDETISSWKDQETQQKKLRQREEDEYIYKRDLVRQKDGDQYLAQKQILEQELATKRAQFEKDFADRENNIVAKEQELVSLRQQVEEFPKKIQAAIHDTEKSTEDKIKFKYEYEAKLTQKEVEGERKLHQQMIAALEAKIVQQDQQVKELAEKANRAGVQVQEIAVKAIEGASGQRFYQGVHTDKNTEQQKQ